MSNKQINSEFLYNMLANGYRNLALNENQVNDLNVFPVPDGDTGTNMVKTLAGGIAINASDYKTASSLMKQFSKSVLLSARGNSGVILSQYIRGFANAAENKDTLSIKDVAQMLTEGVKCAYSAVPTPVEGTMLTVMREGCENIDTQNFDDLNSLFNFVIDNMKVSLQKTPELLPVLKSAGVVDSGGMGLIYFIEGVWAYLNGETINIDEERESYISFSSNITFGPDTVLEYGYCTEFVLQLMNYKTSIPNFSLKDIITYLNSIGDSVVAVQDDDIVKIHVHTFTPEKALAFARNFGEFVSVKIENMSIQHNESVKSAPKQSQKLKYAVVTVAMGEGIKNYFAEIGANRIIEGGQTQNPSAQDFLDAFSSLNAEHIVVLPNNSNIYATAKQAADLYDACNVHVLQTKSIAEGYSALSMMNTWAEDVDSFISDMTSGLDSMVSGSITKAVHDANIDGFEIKENMYMGIANGTILSTGTNNNATVLDMLKNIADISDKCVITIFYGDDVSEKTAEKLVNSIMGLFPSLECGAIYGGQKLYDYYLAIE